MEVRIRGADLRDPVLAHQHDGVQIVHEVAAKPWMARDVIGQDIQMPIRRTQDTDTRTLHERRNPLLCLTERQRLAEHFLVRAHPKELVDNVPRHIPPSVRATPGLDEFVRLRMLVGVGIHGIPARRLGTPPR